MNTLAQMRLAKMVGATTRIHISGGFGPDDRDEYDDDETPCCMGGVMHGPAGCTCWTPIYDQEQAEPKLSVQPVTLTVCCHDCAYRNGSPEREGGYTDELVDIAACSHFACHQGMRRAVKYVHPNGREIEAEPGDYQPPMLGEVAFNADGTAAPYCAGWAAYRRGIENA